MKKVRFVPYIFAGLMVSSHAASGGETRFFSGNPRIDLFSSTIRIAPDTKLVFDSLTIATADSTLLGASQPKSPWIAGGLSLGLPGAGEFYSENYIKSAAFFGVELITGIVALVYNGKGDSQTDTYKAFADLHWSVVQYAQWMIQYQGANVPIDPNTNLPPWQRVNWDSLNLYERRGGFGFTHTLPRYGEQQYYELIGKYHQYSPGWDDYTSGLDFLAVSPRFSEYAEMRGKANDYYNIAGTAVSVLLVNHVLSAIDAFFTASQFNRQLRAQASMSVRQTPLGAFAETKGTVQVIF